MKLNLSAALADVSAAAGMCCLWYGVAAEFGEPWAYITLGSVLLALSVVRAWR